jgi:hypothetical protein
VILDRKMTEYLTSKYKNDPETLKTELLKKDLEPYVHYSIDTVLKVYGRNEAQKKGLFADWWETLTAKDMVKTKEQLEKSKTEWINTQLALIVPDKIEVKEPIINQI